MTLSYFTTSRFASTGVCVRKLFFGSRRNATSAIARRRQLGHKSRPSRCFPSLYCAASLLVFFAAPGIQVAQKFLNPSALAETTGNFVVLFLGSCTICPYPAMFPCRFPSRMLSCRRRSLCAFLWRAQSSMVKVRGSQMMIMRFEDVVRCYFEASSFFVHFHIFLIPRTVPIIKFTII